MSAREKRIERLVVAIMERERARHRARRAMMFLSEEDCMAAEAEASRRMVELSRRNPVSVHHVSITPDRSKGDIVA